MSKTARILPLLAMLALSLPATASGAAGDLDPSFDGDGKRTLNHGGSDVARAVMVQPDGKILVAGSGGSNQDFTVARLHPDGSLDDTFAGDGTAVADFGGNDQGQAAALQPDGKIVVVGATDLMSNTRMAVARFSPDGSLDATFAPGGADGDGKKVFGIGEQPMSPTAVVLQPDGRIVVVGCCDLAYDFAVTRLNRDGSVDGTSFENTDFGGQDSPNAVALQPDGKIVVAGDTIPSGSPPRMAVARYNLDGTLDDAFGGTGMRTFGAGEIVSAQAVQVQPDGRIVVAGYGNDDIDFVVTRLNSDASFDTTFGAGGTSTIDFGLVEGAFAAVLQPDGKIVVAGIAQPSGSDTDFAAARLLPAGRLDTTFSSDGMTTLTSGALESAYAVALQPDGRIVLAGSKQVVTHDVALVRLEGVTPPAGGGPGHGGAGADRTAPILSRFSASRRSFRTGRRGTTLTVELSEPARVRFDVLAVSTGRRVGARCRKPTRVNRTRGRCTLRTRAGGFSRSLAAGRSRLTFSGRAGGRALRPGRYTLRATPTDAAGNTGSRRAVALRIVRP